MKNCPECGKELPDEVAYCLYCGTNTAKSKQYKLSRKIFFVTPFFWVLISMGLCYDLSIEPWFENSIAMAGVFSCIYFAGAALFGIFRYFFGIYVIPGNYFAAGVSSLINSLTTILAVAILENSLFLEKFEKLGPTANTKNHIILLALILIPLQLIETLAISAYAKISTKPETATNSFQKLLFKRAYIIIPLIFIIATAIGACQLQETTQYAILGEGLMTISAFEEAEKYLDKGLEKNANDAKLCSLKANYLAESILFSQTPSSPNRDIEALKLSEKAAMLKPAVPTYKYRLSLILEMQHNPERAIKIASEAVALDNKDPLLWQNLANLNQKYRHYDEAINAYEKVLAIEPENGLAMNNLAYTLLTCNREIPTALVLAQKSVELIPSTISNLDTLAWAYYKNNYYPEALETISIIYKDRSEVSPEIDFHYAAILNAMGLLKNPIETFDKMIVKPEIILNKNLILEIIDERQKAEEKSKKDNEQPR